MAKAMQGPHELLLLCEAILVNRIQATCPHKCPRRGGAGPSGNRHRDPAWPFPPLPASPPPAHQASPTSPIASSLSSPPCLAQTLARWKVRSAVRRGTERMGWRERVPTGPETLGSLGKAWGPAGGGDSVCSGLEAGTGFNSHHPSSERSDLPAEGTTWPEFSPYRTVWLWEGPQAPHLQKTERRAPDEEQMGGQRSEPSPGQRRGRSCLGHPTHAPTASCTAVRTEASSLNTEDTFRKAETTFSGSDVSV